ncbi:hypothetical protein [Natrinema salaciae]|uniref:hypothetical protein n=1 Tax=Natrinema salaciae TaxID=1186196 RepID=UPI001113EA72|nr:hypothetical protein [Natrinema salaciae]
MYARNPALSGGDGRATWAVQSEAVVSLADTTLPFALAAGVLAVIGVAIVVQRRFATAADDGDDPTSTDSSRDEIRTDSAANGFEERFDETTLERLEPIVPDAVERVRDLESETRDDHESARERIERAERILRRGLEDALADGRLEPGLAAPTGEPYEIVNLPARYRELSLPSSGETVHVNAAEQAVRDRLEDGTIRELAMVAAAVDEHREAIHEHVRRREGDLVELRAEVDGTLADVRDLTDRLEGPLADRVDDFVLAGRHDSVPGVADIERDLSDATDLLHRCSFEDARRKLRDADDAADDLLVTVDFLGGLVGTIEHGGGTVALPEAVPTALMRDLAPIVERQYGVDVTLEESAIEITDREGSDGGAAPDRTDEATLTSEESSNRAVATGSGAATGGHAGVTTEAIADEILFVLRELDGGTGVETVQCQTDRLPDSVARPAVLDEVAAYCRRQTDVVAAVDLQEGAPPGFLEIEFSPRTSPQSGLETLRERFVERHGR